MRKLIILAVILCVAPLAGWGYLSWQKFLTSTEVLKDKDQIEYQEMREKFSGFSFEKGFELYRHLRATSKAQFIEMRFNALRKKWREDKTFRGTAQDQEKTDRRRNKDQLVIAQTMEAGGLEPKEGKRRNISLRIRWELAPAWQKALFLREQCIKYLSKEKQNTVKRRNLHSLPNITASLGGTGDLPYSVAEFCETIVPNEPNDQELNNALEALREQMNYYRFVELANETGIDNAYPPSLRLKRMAIDLIE